MVVFFFLNKTLAGGSAPFISSFLHFLLSLDNVRAKMASQDVNHTIIEKLALTLLKWVLRMSGSQIVQPLYTDMMT